MKRGKKDAYKKLKDGAICYDKVSLGKLKAGELEQIVILIQSAAQNVVDDIAEDGRVVLLGYGNPAVVEVDLKRLKKFSYDEVRQELGKLVDNQRRAALPVQNEDGRLEKLLGR